MVQGNEPSVQWIEVDAGALEHNLSLFRSLLQPETALLGVVKANAYGHGMLSIARALELSDAFAVARLDEALQLRQFLIQESIDKPILILEGVASIGRTRRALR